MKFPLYKEWMGETITISDTYCAGVSEFLKYAKRNTDDEVLPCPCVKCKNGSNESPDMIKLHLIKWGIRKDYTLWDFHGETNEFPYVPERMQLDEELKPHPILNDLIDDAFEVHGMPPNISNDFVDGYTSNIHDEFLNEDKDYIRLKCEATRPLYDIPAIRKQKVIEIMGGQVKTWKKNLRAKYFEGLDAAGILQLRDCTPEQEGIPRLAWSKFIDRESSTEKMAQKEQNKANRKKKIDVHCSGRTSYAQTSNAFRKMGKKHGRSELYIHHRKQKKADGAYHPKVVETVERILDIQSSQGENSSISLDDDPLAQVFGKESRGRVRGVGSKVSRTQLKYLESIQPELDDITSTKTEFQEMKATMNNLLDLVKNLVKEKSTNGTASPSCSFPPVPLSPMFDDSLIPQSSPACHITPQSTKLGRYLLFGFSHSNPIALGDANPHPTPGALVHGRPLQEQERRVSIIKIMDGMENEPLYMGNQGGTNKIGELVGAFVVWPFALMRLA